MAAAAEQLGNLSVASYVQLTDTEMECDGVLSYDRTPKFSAEQIAMIRKGAGNQTASFQLKPFIYQKGSFAKTGSGQTSEDDDWLDATVVFCSE
jgi:hypothetical protein